MSEHGQEHKHEIVIHIDRHQFKVEQESMTGAELRQLPSPPIGEDYDLNLEHPGGQDEVIADDQSVTLENGMHFFSSPKHITPGG